MLEKPVRNLMMSWK